MTFMLPSRSAPAFGRQLTLLSLPPPVRCSVFLALSPRHAHLLHRQSVFSQLRHASSIKIQPSLKPNKGQKIAVKAKTSPLPQRASSGIPAPSSPAPSPPSPVKPGVSNIVEFPDKINPPQSTLPAPLDVPEKQPGQGRFKHLYSVGKAYANFYKTGLKNVYYNSKERRNLVAIERHHNALQKAMLSPPSTKSNPVLDQRALGKYDDYPLTRAQYQFFVRAWHDTKRIPIFALLFIVFGEYLPLIVVLCTPLVPLTCRIPKQILKSRKSAEERRRASFRGALGPVPLPVMKGGELVRELKELDGVQVNHVARSLGLYSGLWDRLGALWPPEALLRRRIRKRLEYLELDDFLLRRDGGSKLLEGEWVTIAAEERGLDVLRHDENELKRLLRFWEKGSKDGMTLSLLLSRPSVWAEEKEGKKG